MNHSHLNKYVTLCIIQNMEESKDNKLKDYLRLFRFRIAYIAVSLVIYIFFLVAKKSKGLDNFITDRISYPIRSFLARICSIFRYSVAEWFLILLALSVVVFFVFLVVSLIKRKQPIIKILFRYFTLLLVVTITIVNSVELLLNIPYYSDGFTIKSGLIVKDSSVRELYTTTVLFAEKLSTVSPSIKRDSYGIYDEDIEETFSDSLVIYRNIEKEFPFLKGTELRAKKVRFSKALSLVETTGVAFPLTGEANINIDQPACDIPSTIAHEIAHQRGISSEKEANFVAILACDLSDNNAYRYSGYLMAYTYLGNALIKENRELYRSIYETLPKEVKKDLEYCYDYWEKYDTKVSDVSDNLYDSFLKSQGQDLGIKSYGAVVDLLIAYYN